MLSLRRPPTHPGEMLLEEFLKPSGLTQAEAARRMAMPLNRLNEVVRGKRGVTADTALRLARLLGTSAELWLNLQIDWDLWHAAKAMRRAS
ncbi:MAG: HigA family addiction module antitoxin [Vicinamibacterales bacterium]